jgi:3-dehydroquinate dehydratase-2
MKILILNGPNLNIQGQRQVDIYGTDTFEGMLGELRQAYPELTIDMHQSNHEGQLIDWVHQAGFSVDALIINAGAYTHTSLALADAIAAVPAVAVEVHLSNIFGREPIRQTSLLAPHCMGVVAGFGINSYFLALEACVLQLSGAE